MISARHSLCPTLVLLAGLAGAAERPVDVDRSIRVQEAGQRNIASSTATTVKDLAQLAEEIRCNQIGSDTEIASLETSADSLRGLTDSEAEKTMPWVQARLATARGEQAGSGLGQASEAQTGLVKSLDTLVEKMQEKPPQNANDALKQAIEKQEKAKADTEKLAEKTLGQEKKDLSASEKAETERIAQRQQQVEKAVKDAVKQIREQAKTTSDPKQKSDLQKAADQLEQAQAPQAAQQAQQDIKDNQLSQATQKQQQVLDALTQAAKTANLAPKTSPPLDAAQLAKLQAQLEALKKLEQRQQEALNAAKLLNKQSPPHASSQMQKIQYQIAKDLAQAKEAAAKPASEAAEQLPKSPEEARKSMQVVLVMIKQSKQSLEQQIKNGVPKPKPPQDSLSKTLKANPLAKGLGNLQEGAKNTNARTGQWKVQLQAQEREVLATGAGEKFPERYEEALTQYYRALANGGAEQQ